MALAGFAGFLDATYLTARHYSGAALQCGLVTGCEEVTTSRYATLFGIPIALPGSLYYLALFFLTLAWFDGRSGWPMKVLPSLTVAGFGVSLYLVYLQLWVLEAICQYCMLSAALCTVLFISGMVLYRLTRQDVLLSRLFG